MKRYTTGLLLLLTIAVVLQLTGCGNAIPEMTEREQRMVTEYAAYLLLKYDANYQSNLLTEEESRAMEEEMIREAERAAQIREQQEWEEQQAAQSQESGSGSGSGSGGSSESSAPVYTDIDSFLGLNGLEIEYAGYLVCDSYPQNIDSNDWQGVARAGTDNTTLVVFTFTLTNVSGSDYMLDMASSNAKFTFKINNSIIKSSLTTLLANDLLMYRGVIPAGESTEAVLLIEIQKSDAESISAIKMIMKLGDERAETTLL